MDLLLAQPEPLSTGLEKGMRHYWDIFNGDYRPVPRPHGMLILEHWKQDHGVIKKNSGASLIDLGDGVACLEFHSKMNALGGDTIQMVQVRAGNRGKRF